MNVRKLLLLLFCAGLMTVSLAFADEGVSNEQLFKEIRSLKETINSQAEKIEQLERRLSQQESQAKQVYPEGAKDEFDRRIDERLKEKFPAMKLMEDLQMGIGATTVVQGTHNANGDSQSRKEDVTDASYSLDLTFLKKFEDYGQAFVHLEQGNGQGVENELKVFSSVNRDADSDNNVRATEVWYEHYFSPKKIPLTVTFGKLDPTGYIDDNTYANDETAQFLGRVFRNSPVIEFPDNSGGIRLGYAPFDLVDFNFLALDGNADWEDIFDGMFYAGQLNFKPKLLGRDGNYRLLGWFNDQNHTKWLDTTKDKEKGYGFGISFDQELTKELGIFLRYGWQNPKVYLNTASAFSLEQSYSLGGQLKGNLWGRNDDVVALAFGQIFPSDDYKKADASRRAKLENHLECYYNYRVNGHLSLSPDLQVIWNPYGKDATNGDSTIVVGGLRGQVDF